MLKLERNLRKEDALIQTDRVLHDQTEENWLPDEKNELNWKAKSFVRAHDSAKIPIF